jgi:hypothetical protein
LAKERYLSLVECPSTPPIPARWNPDREGTQAAHALALDSTATRKKFPYTDMKQFAGATIHPLVRLSAMRLNFVER